MESEPKLESQYNNEDLTRQLEHLLETTISEDMEDYELYGSAPLEGERVELFILPEDKKAQVKSIDPDYEPLTYYIKTDAHSPEPFHMPDGNLKSHKNYDISSIHKTEAGLRIGIGYQGRGLNFFYASSLEGLEFEVVDKTQVEKAQYLLRNTRARDIHDYELNIAKMNELTRMVSEIEECIQVLPKFDVESPNRYAVDLLSGGGLYRLEDEQLHFLYEFGPSYNDLVHGNFIGTRIEIIDEKVVVIDDESELALGCGNIDVASNSQEGLAYLQALNLNKNKNIKRYNEKLLS